MDSPGLRDISVRRFPRLVLISPYVTKSVVKPVKDPLNEILPSFWTASGITRGPFPGILIFSKSFELVLRLLTPIYKYALSILGSPEKSKSQSSEVKFLYDSLIFRPRSSEIVPIIFPDSHTDSFKLSPKGKKYFRSEVFISDFSIRISSLTFSVKLSKEFAESPVILNLEILIILLSQFTKAFLRKMFCCASIT